MSIDDFELEEIIDEIDSFDVYEIKDKRTRSKFSANVSKYIEKISKEELNKISKEVKNLSKLNHPTIQRFIGFSFVDFYCQKKPVINQ